jgi:hypothetical protein
MTEGERAGWWAMVYLLMALFATWFTVFAIVSFHIKEWFL